MSSVKCKTAGPGRRFTEQLDYGSGSHKILATMRFTHNDVNFDMMSHMKVTKICQKYFYEYFENF